MGLLSKAKVAAKRASLKRVPRVIRDLSPLGPLREVKPAAQKPISALRSQERETQNDHDTEREYSTTTHEGPRGVSVTKALPDHCPLAAVLPRTPGRPPPPPAVTILPVKAKVVGSHALENTINQKRAARLAFRRAASHASKLNKADYGTMKHLRKLLGMPSPFLCSSHQVSYTPAFPEDALIVSFDTEWERRGLRDHVVEIGVTTLDTRDIYNTAPGPFAHDWFSKAKTYHYVVDITRRPTSRMRSCYFSDDMFADVSAVKTDLLSILRQSAHPPYDGKERPGPRKVVLVGHSVAADLTQLWRSPGLWLDFFSKDVFLTRPTMVFDTVMLIDAAIHLGATVPSAKLGRLVNWLGVHPQYRHENGVIGCHNAGNDAAYTMMTLLMFATRWEDICIRP